MPKKKQLDPTLYTKSGKPRKRKPKQLRNYFTEDTENAIVEYLATEDTLKRNAIYNKRIHHSFDKLAENIIHTFKFYHNDVDDNIEHLKHEVIAFLLQKLDKYQKDKGKAFSYFGTIAKRYLILYNEKVYKSNKQKGSLEEVDEDRGVYTNIMNEKSDIELTEFIDAYVFYVQNNYKTIFSRDIDYKIINAILELFKSRENIDVMNKQAFYVYVKEMTLTNAPQITKVVKVLKDLYIKLQNAYYLTGEVNL